MGGGGGGVWNRVLKWICHKFSMRARIFAQLKKASGLCFSWTLMEEEKEKVSSPLGEKMAGMWKWRKY